MRAGGGKKKGSAFERRICKALSLWLTNGRQTDCLWRSAMSGGRATVGRKKGESIRQAGDICAVSPEGFALTDLFYFELKHVRNLRLHSFIFSSGPLQEFWDEAVSQARHYKKSPVLIARSGNMPTIVLEKKGSPHFLHDTIPPLAVVGRYCEVRKLDDILAAKYKGD